MEEKFVTNNEEYIEFTLVTASSESEANGLAKEKVKSNVQSDFQYSEAEVVYHEGGVTAGTLYIVRLSG